MYVLCVEGRIQNPRQAARGGRSSVTARGGCSIVTDLLEGLSSW